MILDPLKPHKDGRKVFQFNRMFGPTATQGIISHVILLNYGFYIYQISLQILPFIFR